MQRYSVIAFFLAACFCGSGLASTLPTDFNDSLLVTGLSDGTAMELAPDGRIFFCMKGGALRVYKAGTLLATPFVTLDVDAGGERGLLGVACDPDFVNNGYLYLYYTARLPAIHNRVSRFKANGDVADLAAGETVLLDLDDQTGAAGYHQGGGIHFSADGKLFVAVGEHGIPTNSQSLATLRGKMLRMNPVPDAEAQVPSDNPYYGTASGKNRLIWCLGLRNPFSFAFQTGTSRLFINDVGQNAWEEINEGQAGRNFGWPQTEGSFNPASYPPFTLPVYSYAHSGSPSNRAVVGGTFYNPSTPTFPAAYVGKYFFSDLAINRIWYLDPAAPPAAEGATEFCSGISTLVDLKVGTDGALYYLSRNSASTLGKIQFMQPGTPPTITLHPNYQTVTAGRNATFTVSAMGSAPLNYQWQKNDVNISGATGSTYTTPPCPLGDNGATYRCVVSNGFGIAQSAAAILTVSTNTAPVATIVTPSSTSHYNAGDTISFSGSGSDAEDGPLDATRFTWRVDFHHDEHVHPAMPDTSGSTFGSYVTPNTGEPAADVWYRIYLTVQDSQGLTHTVYRDVFPNTCDFSVVSNPPGLQVTLDSQPLPAPGMVTGVVGMTRTLGVVSPQTFNGRVYVFVSWSDGNAATHDISTPSSPTTYTAQFKALPPDANGDGKADILLRDASTGEVLLWIMP